MKENIGIIATIIGTLGGILGIISWFRTSKQSNRHFNQLTYNNHIKYKYKLCFENNKCPQTDNVNIFYLWNLINNIREFKKHNNKFKGIQTSSAFNNVFLYANVIIFDNFTALNWFNSDTEINNQHTIDDYNEKKIHIQRLKPYFQEFYLSIFENID